MPISEPEFYEYRDDSWKSRVFEFLNEKRESTTPAYDILEIAKDLTQTDTILADTKRKIEWALEDLVTEGKVIKTRIKIDDYYYYMAKEITASGAVQLTIKENQMIEKHAGGAI
jgi:hypothetical protein